MVKHVGVFTAALACALGTAGAARADAPSPWAFALRPPVLALGPALPMAPVLSQAPGLHPQADPYAAMPLVKPEEKHYVRAAAEIGGILAVGLVDYLLNTTARGGTLRAGEVRWDLRYDWETLRDKLTGAGLDLDTNRFPTNYAAHPFAGTLYFQAARSNHLSFAESFLYAILGSATWEYFGEIRETTSMNDLIVTPVSGAALGEATMQLSAFFGRGDKRLSNDALSFLFSPVRALNYAFDGSSLLRSSRTDELGFSREIWHRFVASAGAGVTIQEDAGASHPGGVYADQRVGIDLSLANLPGYGGAGKESHLYDDGNVSSFLVDATFSRGRAVDALFATRIVPIGYYVRDASADEEERPRGTGGLVGYRMGFEYGMHDWDRDGSRPVDITCFASPVGVAAEHVYARGPWQIRTAFDLYGAITGVTPYALGDYRRLHDNVLRGLLSPLRDQGYYHSASVSVVPAVEVAWRSLHLGVKWRYDTFRPIRGLDAHQAIVDDAIRMSDTRSMLQATLAVTPHATAVRFAVDGKRLTRHGELGAVQASRSETSLLGSVGVVF